MIRSIRGTITLLLGAGAVGIAATGCRIEKVKSPDTATAGNEPGPGINACGITPGSRVSEDGIGLLRIGTSLDAVRASCAILSEQPGVNDAPSLVRIDLGPDTAATEFVAGVLRRITLHHSAYRTADSLGVGTSIARIMALRSPVGMTDRNRLYAVSPAYCGLRFMLEEPAPPRPSAQSGIAALRRLPGETRVRELEIVGCVRRR
jgi:hypothetical protein